MGIPVVVSQAAAANADARRLEEDLIAALMLERGIDISVVPHLPQLRDDSTGLLCLQGIKGDLVVLTWVEPELARRQLSLLGIQGREWPDRSSGRVGLSRSAILGASALSQARRLRILQLDAAVSSEQVLQEIRRLRDELATRPLRAGDLPVIGRPPLENAPPAAARSSKSARPASFSPPLPVPPPAVSAAGDELDQLLDQLDAFDR